MSTFKINSLILLFTIILGQNIQAQADSLKIDSLQSVLNKNLDDTTRINTLFALGDQLSLTDPTAAMRPYEQAFALAQKINNVPKIVTGAVNLIHPYVNQLNDIEKADPLIDMILNLSSSHSYNYGIAKGFYYKAISNWRKNQIDSSYAAIKKMIQISEELNHDGLLSSGYGHASRILRINGDYQEALTYIKKALALAIIEGQPRKIGLTYYNLGDNYNLLGKLDSTMIYLDSAIVWSAKSGDASLTSRIKLIKAQKLSSNNQAEMGLQDALDALDLATKNNFAPILIEAYGNIGLIYKQIEKPKLAKKYFFLLDSVAKANSNDRARANAFSNLGLIFLEEANPDSARYFLHESKKINFANESFRALTADYINLGKSYHDYYQTDSAEVYYLLAKGIADKYNIPDYSAIINNKLSGTSIDKGDFQSAIKYHEASASALKELGQTSFYLDALNIGVMAYEGARQYEKAFKTLKTYTHLKDSLESIEKNLVIEEIQAKYDLKAKSEQIAAQQLTLEKEKNKRNNIIVMSSFLVLLLGGLFFVFRLRQRLKIEQNEIELQVQKSEAQKLLDLDQMKSSFFANISHEFRTPLTLIMGPINDIINSSFTGNLENYHKIIHRNASKLLSLINQILDLSKLDAGKLFLNASEGDFVNFVKAQVFSFESAAERKNILLKTIFPETKIICWFDREKMGTIISNLLSNALKFTPEGGQVGIQLVESGKNQMSLTIEDNGIGMDSETMAHIFDRFYQSSTDYSSPSTKGTGIGLALAKELVELHKGTILVTSQPSKGSIFKLVFPILKADDLEVNEKIISQASNTELNDLVTQPIFDTAEKTELTPELDTHQSSILIVEDNDDMRRYIADVLRDNHQIILARNGKTGVDQARKYVPDLIISDIMMPEIDGYRLAEIMKQDERTSHIPIILLTALAELDDKLKGFERGVDDFLIKPFDSKELIARVQNLISLRKRLYDRYTNTMDLKPGEVAVSSYDEVFIVKVKKAINAHLDDESFGVEELAKEVHLSRFQLSRKVKAITNISPNILIRTIRLERAKYLLKHKIGNATEVAYMVGFSSPSYFSTCFSEYFGTPPSSI